MAKLETVLLWLTVRQMCEQAKVCQNTGYNWIWQRRVEAIQVAGSWRVNPKDVERILQQRAERRAARQAKVA